MANPNAAPFGGVKSLVRERVRHGWEWDCRQRECNVNEPVVACARSPDFEKVIWVFCGRDPLTPIVYGIPLKVAQGRWCAACRARSHGLHAAHTPVTGHRARPKATAEAFAKRDHALSSCELRKRERYTTQPKKTQLRKSTRSAGGQKARLMTVAGRKTDQFLIKISPRSSRTWFLA